MKHLIVKIGILALLMACVVPTVWGQADQNATKPGSAPKTTKKEEDAYKAFYNGRTGDPMHEISMGEDFIAKYPMSPYLFAVYSTLTGAYLQAGQIDKMTDVGNKALFLNPDDIDVLPIMGWAIARQVTGKTPDAAGQLQKAAGYAHHGLDLVSTMPKPADIDDAGFAKAKNQKLSMCHSALGTIDMKTNKYDDAVVELNQAVMLATTPDMVDLYLLGLADEQTSHYAEAQTAYGKCAVNGSQVANQCKSGIADAKDKSKNSLQAPK